VDHGARVINLSLSFRQRSNQVAEAISEAIEEGVTVVGGAGNRGTASLDFPAGEPGVISVAATDDQGVRMPVSNYGPDVAISAPGSNVLSSYGGFEYAHWGGTSMAAPFVTGGAALLLQRYPTLGSPHVYQKVRQTATNISSQNPGYASMLGAGLVNLEGLETVLAPNADTLRVRKLSRAIVSWERVEGASAYDLVRGSVSNLAGSDEGALLGPLTCLANNTSATSSEGTPDLDLPAPGRAFFYLMRPVDGSVPHDYGVSSDGNQRQPGPGDCAH
jgi:subtilisin family serine protease